MASYYEGGGAIGYAEDDNAAEDDNDNSGAAPVTGSSASAPAIDTSDNSGAIPVAPQAAPRQDQLGPGVGPLSASSLQAFPGNVKRIVSYLMGADAVPPTAIDQAASQVDPQGQMSAADRNLLAIDAAREKGGDNAAWALMQANRVAYNAQTAFARTALQGTQQKPADLDAAVDAANKAQANVLDGSNVQFSRGPDGAVTAAVTPRGAAQPRVFNLSAQQFGQWLDLGGDGQWDKVMSASAPAVLQKIAESAAPGPQGTQAPPQGATAPSRGMSRLSQLRPLQSSQQPPAGAQTPVAQEDSGEPPPAPRTNFGKTPSTLNLSGSDAMREPPEDKTNYGEELEQRAMRMFPGITQENQRNQWMAAQEQREQELQNKVDVAKETGERRVEAARATGSGRVEAARATGQSREAAARTHGESNEAVAKTKANAWQYASDQKRQAAMAAVAQKSQQMQGRNANDAQNRMVQVLRTKLGSGAALSPEEQNYLNTLPGVASLAQQGSAPQPQQRQAPPSAPPAQSPGQPPVQGAKFYKGTWYTRGPNGESVPVQ